MDVDYFLCYGKDVIGVVHAHYLPRVGDTIEIPEETKMLECLVTDVTYKLGVVDKTPPDLQGYKSDSFPFVSVQKQD